MRKKLFPKKSMMRIMVLVGVIVIPLMYSLFYLGAFWDPYSRLESLPVAVVNSDLGAPIDGQMRNLGKEVCARLVSDGSLDFIVTDPEDALSGTKGEKYYAMIEFPEDFSKNIASSTTTNKQQASIVYSANEKKNYLASQILSKAVLQLEMSTQESITNEVVASLSEQISDLPSQLVTLKDGLDQLSAGSSTLAKGSQDLAGGTNKLAQNFSQYSQGINDLSAGTSKLQDGTSQLAAGAGDLRENLKTYTQGVDSLIETANATSSFISSYVQANPQLLQDPTFMAFIVELSDPESSASLQALANAGTQLNSGAAALAAGAQSVNEGAADLNEGTMAINEATTKIKDATDQINQGAGALSEGISQLDEGLHVASSEVGIASEEAAAKTEVLEGLSEFASNPVQVDTQTINPIANYGTSFAPYFMSLSLWVGALMIFFGIYFDGDGHFKILNRHSDHKLIRSLIYLGLGLAQAIVLGLVLIMGLGLEVDNLPLYFGALCLVSMVFIAIVQFCIVHLGNLGKFCAIALLILQLTSCGGTFPMETVPKFFQALYPFMPMTYSVALFKDGICGTINHVTTGNFLILAGILIAFMIVTIGLTIIKSHSQEGIEPNLEPQGNSTV
ncbi:MAG: YhgE/Pip domain-containing protein [Erysipelotrichaceae bacterium]|nr:YhgE/Pip domain-containing protein [Erysipelotrichaceae bacterium]MDD3809821.1 YhgE/Pip domain-containing protein [Erysipelotrichaceae bacterium]